MDLFKILGGKELENSEESSGLEPLGSIADAGVMQRGKESREHGKHWTASKWLIHIKFLAYKVYKSIRRLFRSRYSRRLLGLFLSFLILLPTILLLFRPAPAKAAWFDDSYGYRQKITFTHNANLTNASMRLTVSNTNTLVSAGKMQTSCNDSRFTDANGKVLRFNLVSGCNSASTVYDVVFPTVINGNNLAYFYYGNPSAISASDPSVPTGTTPSGSTSFASEEKGPQPVLYWKFDEGYGITANDSSSWNNSGTISGATWQNNDLCYLQNCLKFNGTSDKVSRAYSSDKELDPGTGDFTVSIWFRHPSAVSATRVMIARSNNAVNNIGYKLYMNSSVNVESD